jgi:hypothetical protein
VRFQRTHPRQRIFFFTDSLKGEPEYPYQIPSKLSELLDTPTGYCVKLSVGMIFGGVVGIAVGLALGVLLCLTVWS